METAETPDTQCAMNQLVTDMKQALDRDGGLYNALQKAANEKTPSPTVYNNSEVSYRNS